MGISVEKARELTVAFTQDYPGALELGFKFRDTPVDLYGDRGVNLPMMAGYRSKSQANSQGLKGTIDVALNNVPNEEEFIKSLRHEVLGHYGINSFAPEDKKLLLEGIIEAKNDLPFKNLWNYVVKHYPNESILMQAEEVLAYRVETLEPELHKDNPNVHSIGAKSFQDTCVEKSRLMTVEDLDNITLMIAQGIRDKTREQKTFPVYGIFGRQADRQTQTEELLDKILQNLPPDTQRMARENVEKARQAQSPPPEHHQDMELDL